MNQVNGMNGMNGTTGSHAATGGRAHVPTLPVEHGAPADDAVAQAVARGLLRARKSLPPWLLYDDAGSGLFEAITRVPEYYLTRTERAILLRDAGAMVEAAGGPLEVVELGAGSATKTRVLLEAALARQGRLRYVPVDVSPAAIAQ